MSYNNHHRYSPPRRQGPGGYGAGPGYSDPADQYYNDNSDIYSQYSQPSYVSNNQTNQNNNSNNAPYQNTTYGQPRTITPGYPAAPAAPPTSYSTPTPAPAPGVGDYFNHPSTQIQPRPSFSSSHHPYHQQDFPDETKSYTSTSNLNNNKEWGVGEVVPPLPVPTMNMGYPPRSNANSYAVSPMAYQPPQTPGGTAHWHQVRNQLLERRVVKQVPLINGNLVMDVPVAKGCIPSQTGLGTMPDEMEKLRYSAATCDPDDFMRKKFSLRPYLWGRKTELFVRARPLLSALDLALVQAKEGSIGSQADRAQIVMTMYNEDDGLFLRTLNAVIKNIAHLTTRTRSKTWGAQSWQKVVVCIVADGRKVIDSRVLKILQLMGVYAEVSSTGQAPLS